MEGSLGGEGYCWSSSSVMVVQLGKHPLDKKSNSLAIYFTAHTPPDTSHLATYLLSKESSVTGLVGKAEAATLQKYHPLVRALIPPQEEASPGEVVAESLGV